MITLANSENTHWAGSFSNTVEYLAVDLLADGYPVHDVTIRTTDAVEVTGTLTECYDRFLTVDSRRFAIDDVDGMWIR